MYTHIGVKMIERARYRAVARAMCRGQIAIIIIRACAGRTIIIIIIIVRHSRRHA